VLFDVATNFTSDEEAVGAIFDCKTSKRKEDAPAEGSSSKTKTLAKKQKWGKKGKKSAPQNQRGQGKGEDSDDTFVASPGRKGP
jgi:hypothetical protein